MVKFGFMKRIYFMMGSLLKEDLSVSFDKIEDPRLDRSKKYPLSEIIFLAIFAALLGITHSKPRRTKKLDQLFDEKECH